MVSITSDASICGTPGQDSMETCTNSMKEELQRDTSGADKMDVDVRPENVQTFRQNSLALVTYPWTSGVVMQSDWSKFFDEEHFAFRFSACLNKFDIKLATTSPTLAYVRTALRDVSCDRYINKTTRQIVTAETGDLMKSPNHASAVCSVLTAYRLLDIIYALDNPDDRMQAPHHEPLEVDFSSYKISKKLADWESVARKFHKTFKSKQVKSNSVSTCTALAPRQVSVLHDLHTAINSHKALFNLQLAATHIAFMLDSDSSGQVTTSNVDIRSSVNEGTQIIPDLPCSSKTLDGSFSMSSIESAALHIQFETLLKSLDGDQNYDHLRLALQASTMITPICLLQEILIHRSSYYSQRYRLIMYGKGVGNGRPKSVIRLETIIWRALFDIACGEITVYDAAQVIANAIPDIVDNMEEKDSSWFQLDNPEHSDVHLSSFNVVESSVPEKWPMFDRLVPSPPPAPVLDDPQAGDSGMSNSNESGHATPPPAVDQGGNHPMSTPPMPDQGRSNAPPSPGDDMEVDDIPSTSTAPPSNILQKRASRSNAKRNYRDLDEESSEEEMQGPAPSKTKKAKYRKSPTASRTATTSGDLRLQVQQNRPVPPIIVGTQCMQFDIIDLKTIETEEPTTFSMRTPQPSSRTKKLSFVLKPYGACEPSTASRFEFSDEKEHSSFVALERSVYDNFVNGHPRHVSDKHNSYLVIISKHHFLTTPTPLIHAHLQDRCIVVTDMKVGYLPFTRQGFRKLDALDTPVLIEDQSDITSDQPLSEKLVSGTLRQFIDNVESRKDKKVLRIVRMPSEASPEYTPYGSEFVAWRETKSRVYCKQEDPSLIKLLAWNDISTKHATQWWTVTPHGFGLSYDVREGSQWIVIATPPQGSVGDAAEHLHYFAHPRFFIPSFQRMGTFQRPIATEAILLSDGMRIIIPPNMLYAIFTTDDCITSGTYFLSIPNISKTFYGLVHSFIMGTSCGNLCPALYFRRIIHYLHTSLVVNKRRGIENDDDYHHLLTFEDVKNENGDLVKSSGRDVEALVLLCAMALFMNALDKRTYMPFGQAGAIITPEEREQQKRQDFNSIPHIERRHFCYVRGLAFDLARWFFSNYELEGYDLELPPIIAAIALDMVRYKFKAEESGVDGFCSASQFERQIKMALFAFEDFGTQYREQEHRARRRSQADKEAINLPFLMEGYTLVALDPPQEDQEPITDYFNAGKNKADRKYFSAVKVLTSIADDDISE